MKTNSSGLDLIKSFEGLRLQAYPDPATGGAPWTIGYGHTAGVKPGQIITKDQAEVFLKQDLAQFEKYVSDYVKVPVNENEFSALVSFCYNVGPANLKSSTLLKRLNARDRAGAAGQFAAWNKAAGRVMAGLTRRREAERALFLTPVIEVAPAPIAPPSPPGGLLALILKFFRK